MGPLREEKEVCGCTSVGCLEMEMEEGANPSQLAAGGQWEEI